MEGCARIQFAEHDNKQQCEAAPQCLLYAGYMKVAATLLLASVDFYAVNLYAQNSTVRLWTEIFLHVKKSPKYVCGY